MGPRTANNHPSRHNVRRAMHGAVSFMFIIGAAIVAKAADDTGPPITTVGMPGQIKQLVLPGSELEARRIEDRDVPVVLRIVASYRHGTAFRYDLEYYALEAGQFDLRDYLERKDGSPTDDLPEIPIEVKSVLPAGQVLPNDLAFRPSPRLGGYRALLLVLLVIWVIGLIAALTIRRRSARRQQAAQQKPLSLAERLQPLVTAAVENRLSPEGRMEIERLLLTYWRRRLDLDAQDPVAAIAALRQHEQAGALMQQVEAWLHMPPDASQVDVAALLEPYRNLPAEVDQPAHGDHAAAAPTSAAGGAA